MAALERARAGTIDSGKLTLYEANEFQGDLCARLPREECVDQGRDLRCEWSEDGSDSSPEPVCGALLESSSFDGSQDSLVWRSHVGDNPMTVPRKPFDKGRAGESPPPAHDFSPATYK